MIINIQEIEKQHNIKILLAYIRGSHMYGTNTETSDTDIAFIYQQKTDTILRGDYIPYLDISGTGDVVGYEIGRYIELLGQSNPNILESLDIPSDCLLFSSSEMSIFKHQLPFVTKKTKDTILGYAKSQIKKATGLNKNMNTPQPKERKSILEFCYIIQGQESTSFKEWYYEYTSKTGEEHSEWGLVKIPNGKGLFALYTDPNENGNMRGILKDNESTQLRTSEIPESIMNSQTPFTLWYNLDGFEVHCKQHASYWKWMEEKNNVRYKMNQEARQQVDLKNISHLFRLLDMADGISSEKGLRVRSENVGFLQDIRKGRYHYKDLLEKAEEITARIVKQYESCNLPEDVDREFLKDLLLKFRRNG